MVRAVRSIAQLTRLSCRHRVLLSVPRRGVASKRIDVFGKKIATNTAPDRHVGRLMSDFVYANFLRRGAMYYALIFGSAIVLSNVYNEGMNYLWESNNRGVTHPDTYTTRAIDALLTARTLINTALCVSIVCLQKLFKDVIPSRFPNLPPNTEPEKKEGEEEEGDAEGGEGEGEGEEEAEGSEGEGQDAKADAAADTKSDDDPNSEGGDDNEENEESTQQGTSAAAMKDHSKPHSQHKGASSEGTITEKDKQNVSKGGKEIAKDKDAPGSKNTSSKSVQSPPVKDDQGKAEKKEGNKPGQTVQDKRPPQTPEDRQSKDKDKQPSSSKPDDQPTQDKNREKGKEQDSKQKAAAKEDKKEEKKEEKKDDKKEQKTQTAADNKQSDNKNKAEMKGEKKEEKKEEKPGAAKKPDSKTETKQSEKKEERKDDSKEQKKQDKPELKKDEKKEDKQQPKSSSPSPPPPSGADKNPKKAADQQNHPDKPNTGQASAGEKDERGFKRPKDVNESRDQSTPKGHPTKQQSEQDEQALPATKPSGGKQLDDQKPNTTDKDKDKKKEQQEKQKK